MMFLYDLPNLVAGFLIVTFTVVVFLAGYFVYHRLFPATIDDAQRDLAMAVLGIVATVHSLLLAFSAVSVWESYGAAEESVISEANTINQLAHDLAIFNSPESLHARALLRSYVTVVVDDEWPSLQHGQSNDHAWVAVDEVFDAIGALEPDTPKRQGIIYEIWWRANELIKLRRDRLHASQSEIPATLWTVVLIGTILTMLTAYVIPPNGFNVRMIVTLAVSVGLVFFFLIAMDRPFAGEQSIDAGPFRLSLQNMDAWEKARGR